MANIILISGKAEAGKTASAKLIKKHLETNGKKALIMSFAKYLKFITEEYFEWDGSKSPEGRALLQSLGTDVVRNRDYDFWVRTAFDFVNVFGDLFDYIIFDDCRFPNEITYFTARMPAVITIRVTRLEYENILSDEARQHPSETSLDDWNFDLYVNSYSGLHMLDRAILTNVYLTDLWLEFTEMEAE